MDDNRQELPPETPAPQPTERRLYRSTSQRIVGGVAGGLGEYFGIDPVWMRIGFVVLTIGGGSGILLYLLLWLIVPQQPSDYQVPARAGTSLPSSAILGVVLIALGGIAFVNAIAPSIGLSRYFWPALLVAAGLALVVGGLSRDRNR